VPLKRFVVVMFIKKVNELIVIGVEFTAHCMLVTDTTLPF